MIDSGSIALMFGGAVGLLCFLAGLAMVYAPAALLVLGVGLAAGSVALAYDRGKRK